MPAVLGIDAAWTAHHPSGVALIRQREDGTWERVTKAPSYDAFLRRGGIHGDPQPVDWGENPIGGRPELERLLEAAANLLDREERVTVVAVDMPLSLDEPITGRRACDQAIARAFGRMGCSPHSPNAARPGEISYQLRADLHRLGYPLAVNNPGELIAPATIEVYPHPALLCLLNYDYRVPYKGISKLLKYLPGTPPGERREILLSTFRYIYKGLVGEISRGSPNCFLPPYPYIGSLKRYEDALDALVCAWVGARYLAGCATAYGDHTAAIWVPNCRANE